MCQRDLDQLFKQALPVCLDLGQGQCIDNWLQTGTLVVLALHEGLCRPQSRISPSVRPGGHSSRTLHVVALVSSVPNLEQHALPQYFWGLCSLTPGHDRRSSPHPAASLGPATSQTLHSLLATGPNISVRLQILVMLPAATYKSHTSCLPSAKIPSVWAGILNRPSAWSRLRSRPDLASTGSAQSMPFSSWISLTRI